MKNKQGITIAALIIAIVGLSIGFAAFSNTLNISTNASVNPSDANFVVQFSKLSGSDATGDQNPITPDNALYGVNGLIPTSNKRTLTGLKATFTQPGQEVTYNLYVRNTGSYVAYLKDLVFANAANATAGETYKHCYAATKDSNSEDLSSGEMATGSLVTAACNGISISVTIGTSGAITPESQSKSLGNQALAAVNGYVSASVTISYANNASYVDGPMVVEFGDISFTASSTQTVAQQSSPSSPSSSGSESSCIVTNVKAFNTCTLSQDNDSSGTVTLGDKVTCGTESFYVIENPSNGTTKMLAEWNLNLIYSIEANINKPIFPYCASTLGYQDSHVRGMLDYTNDSSLTEYMYDVGNGVYWGYGTVGYNQISSALTAYAGYLNSTLSTNATVRSITLEELVALGCSYENYTCSESPATAPAWVYQTSYWTGSTEAMDTGAGVQTFIMVVSSYGYTLDSTVENGSMYYSGAPELGVRPVVEIASNKISVS